MHLFVKCMTRSKQVGGLVLSAKPPFGQASQ